MLEHSATETASRSSSNVQYILLCHHPMRASMQIWWRPLVT